METYKLIQSELERAKTKHPNFPNDIFQKLAIMQEEVGEVAKAVNEYHFSGGSLQDVKDELIQTAAMCVRMLESLDFYCQRDIEMESAFTKYDMEKAFLAGADKRNWTKIKLTGIVSGNDFTLEPIFDKWFEHYG